jgi:hypothetical protein
MVWIFVKKKGANGGNSGGIFEPITSKQPPGGLRLQPAMAAARHRLSPQGQEGCYFILIAHSIPLRSNSWNLGSSHTAFSCPRAV